MRAGGMVGISTRGGPGALEPFLQAADVAPERIHRGRWRDVDVAVAAADAPWVSSWRHPDGSFLVVDGEDHGPLTLEELLDRVRRQGPGALRLVNGAASCAAWDAATGRLVVARDRTGMPPVFHARSGDTLRWATDATSLLRSGVPRAVDHRAIDAFLSTGFVPAPWTCFAGVDKLAPAHALVCRGGTHRIERWWRPTWGPKHAHVRRERVSRLTDLLETSLRRRADPDRPTGVLLSGGVDSALVAAGLVRLAGAPVTTFTFDYGARGGAMNEGGAARRVADELGIEHHTIPLTAAWLADHLEWMVDAYEEPFSYGIHSARLLDVVRRDVRVLLSGGGADGWYVSTPMARASRLAVLPRPVLAAAEARFPGRARTLAHLAGAPLGELFYEQPANTLLGDDLRAEVSADPELATRGREGVVALYEAAVAEERGGTRRDRFTALNARFSSAEHILWWNHRWARTHGLASRYPYSDADLGAYLARLPRRGAPKDELRRVAARLLPDWAAWAPKYPQALPLSDWLRGPLAPVVQDRLTVSRLAADGLFDPVVVRRCLDEHLAGTADHKWVLWTALCTGLWKERLVDRVPTPAG